MRKKEMTSATTQGELFPAGERTVPPSSASVFAELVFDRPLDHTYSYAVPDEWREHIGVGKRVRAPFGAGNHLTVGFCVGLSETPPTREVKQIEQVIDDQAILTPNLLRLTRWMADYYLCGWGQVLNAVVPAGAKHRAGTKNQVVIEMVPEILWPSNPRPN